MDYECDPSQASHSHYVLWRAEGDEEVENDRTLERERGTSLLGQVAKADCCRVRQLGGCYVSRLGFRAAFFGVEIVCQLVETFS